MSGTTSPQASAQTPAATGGVGIQPAAASRRSGSPPPPGSPPPSNPGDGEIDLRLPQSAFGRGFAAFIAFTLFGNRLGALPSLGLLPELASGDGAAPSSSSRSSGRQPSALASAPPKTGGTLGAAKELTPRLPESRSALWWAYIGLAALAGLIFLFATLAVFRRRRRLPAH